MSPPSNPPIDPSARSKYRLHVTGGPTRHRTTHTTISVNTPTPLKIDSPLMTTYLNIRIKDYNGFPSSSPSTCPYFIHPSHTSDRYSISYAFIPKVDIPGQDLVFGFDFDHSIRDRLPPGFKAAMRIVTGFLDPGLYADPYSDEPYLYGPALSSFFAFHVGEMVDVSPVDEQLAALSGSEAEFPSPIVQEGAAGSGAEIRGSKSIPAASNKRRKHFLKAKNLEGFVFEKGRLYASDFFNPYLDFANFALVLPGLKIPVAKYIDDKTHELRFVVLDRGSGKKDGVAGEGDGGQGDVALCVGFRLVFGEELEGMIEEEKKEGEEGQEEQNQNAGQAMVDEENAAGKGEEGHERHNENDVPPQTPAEKASSARRKPSPAGAFRDDEDDAQDPEQQSAVTALANTISSALAALGFGSSRSTGSSENNSREASPGRKPTTHKDAQELEARVDKMSAGQVEEFLKDRHSSV